MAAAKRRPRRGSTRPEPRDRVVPSRSPKRSSAILANPATVIRKPDGSTINTVTLDALERCGLVNLGSLTIVLADGREVRSNLSHGKLITPSINRIRWVPLRRNGKWNRELRKALRGKAGVYAIKKHDERQAMYVGEGGKRRGAPHLHSKDPDRLLRTILRHFQAGFTPERYANTETIAAKRQRRRDGGKRSAQMAMALWDRGEHYRAGGREWTHHDPGDLDIAVYITEPKRATHHEGRFILELEPYEMDPERYAPADAVEFDVENLAPRARRKAA